MSSLTIGSQKSFAIQFELDVEHHNDWMYGTFYCWINGTKFGNGEITCLRDVLFDLEHMRWPRGDFKNPRFLNLSARQLMGLLLQGINGITIQGTSQENPWAQIAEVEGWVKHRVVPLEACLGGLEAFCIQDDLTERVVWSQPPYSNVWEASWPAGLVQTVREQAIKELQEVYERLRSQPTEETDFGN